MATPTAMKHASSQQGRTPSQSHGAAPTPPVSTPFSTSHGHTAFSPLGPRSSPQQFKKSPANSATLMGHTMSSGGISTGTVTGGGGGGSSSSFPMTYGSPAAAAMGAMGMGGGGPGSSSGGGGGGGLDLGGLDPVSVGGLASSLGLMGRNDEDERAKRLQTVLEMLKSNSGRVSEAGLERLAKSMGLECLWEEGMGREKTRTLIIAGSALALELVMASNVVTSVSVTFPDSQNIVLRNVELANQILLDDLKLRPHESPLTKKMDAFAEHLASLAALDKLSVEPGLNLYEAVAGIYETLERLFRWDVQRLREDPARGSLSDEAALELAAQCTQHGRPTMHENGRLGLSLLYWQERRLVRPRQAATAKYAAQHEKTWAMLVSCAPLGLRVFQPMFQPVRVSDKWLSDAIEKGKGEEEEEEAANHGLFFDEARPQQRLKEKQPPILDWLEPENTILSATAAEGAEEGKASAEEGGAAKVAGSKLPEVMFQAVLTPPVAVPYSVWHHMSEVLGFLLEPETLATFDALSFPVAPGSQHDPSELRTIVCDRDILFVPKGGPPEISAAKATDTETTTTTDNTVKHRHTLFVYKPVYGRVISELPFGHPRQLVELLPQLRQYAFLSTVLEKTFGTRMESIIQDVAGDLERAGGQTEITSTLEEEFEAFIVDQPDSHGSEKEGSEHVRRPGEPVSPRARAAAVTTVDVVLTAHPVPRLQVVFPFGDRSADVTLEIGLNAQVRVISQNILDDENDYDYAEGGDKKDRKGKGRRLEAQDLGRMLEVCEDLGMWCLWIQTRCT